MMASMRSRALACAALVLVAAQSAWAADVKTTVDPAADLTRYPTFTFLEPDPKAKGALTDKRVYDRLRYMIAQHLNKRGYKPAPPGQTGELGVHFSGHATAKQSVLMVGRQGPYSYSWGNQELGGVDTMDYREGSLVVDLVDLARGQLLWRSRITEALTAGYSEENWKKADKALAQAFAKLPQRR
jgi:hypothetical protein